MTLLLATCFVPIFKTYQIDTSTFDKLQMENLEQYRMYWLFGALAVVVGGLLLSYSSAQKKADGWSFLVVSTDLQHLSRAVRESMRLLDRDPTQTRP